MDMDPKYVSLVEVKGLLETEEKNRELSHIQDLALKHAGHFTGPTKTKVNKIIKDLVKIDRVTPQIAFKVAEIMPQDANEVRAIFAKERFTLSPEEIDIILKTVKENV